MTMQPHEEQSVKRKASNRESHYCLDRLVKSEVLYWLLLYIDAVLLQKQSTHGRNNRRRGQEHD